MVKINCNDLSEMAEALFRDSSNIVIITNSCLNCSWVNKLGTKRFPSLSSKNGIIELLKTGEVDDILRCLKNGNGCTKSLNSEPFNAITLEFIPILDNGVFCGSIVFLKTNIDDVFKAKSLESERVLAAFSNEYKMPLTIMFSTLGLISRKLEKSNDESLKDYLKLINQNCYKLLRLANNMVQISQFRSESYELNLKNGDICSFFSGLCNAVSVMIFPLDIRFSYKIPKEKLFLSFDAKMLSIAFLNLISNSCKYTKEGNSIEVSLEVFEKQVVVNVADKGVGIESDVLQHIFEPYYSRNPSVIAQGGAGLGLSLSNYIIKKHNGTIAVCSNEGEGTSVAFTLPIIKDAELLDYTAESSADYLDDRFSPLFVELCNVCNCPMP